MNCFIRTSLPIAFVSLVFVSLVFVIAVAKSQPLAADEIRQDTESMSFDQWPQRQPLHAQFVHRPVRHSPEWEHYRALELYYDDLEDHYRWRDRRLSNYYEQFEGYFKKLRKGRAAIYPEVQPHHIFPSSGPQHFGPQRNAMSTVVPNRTMAMPQVQRFESPNTVPPKTQSPPPPSVALQSDPQSDLERSYRELLTQLSGLTTGDRWRDYLKLPIGQQAGDSRQQFEEASTRYDRILENPDYQVVAQLPAFEATRNLLHEELSSLDMGPTLAGPELAETTLAPAEELPLPTFPAPIE